MKKLMLFLAIMLLVGVAPLEAQNSVDVLGGGATTGEHDRLRREPRLYSGDVAHDSNAGTDIAVAITAIGC